MIVDKHTAGWEVEQGRETLTVRNAAATQGRLLACARRRFLQESYENVGLRDIASEAGVDVALIGRYFGSKEQLFKDVLRMDGGSWHELAANVEDLPSFFADFVTAHDSFRNAEHIERLLIMLRSASSPQASALVRSALEADFLAPLSALLRGDEPDLRAAMALSVLMGTTVSRTMVNVDALQGCSSGAAKERLEKLLRAALDESTAPVG